MICTFENKFCDIVEKLQKIKTDGSAKKFVYNSPLGKFIKSEVILSIKQIMYNELHHLDDLSLEYVYYKEQTVVELQVVFDQLASATFTIKEILSSIPNTKDEERYARWYPFKSKIVAYVDFDETKFNLQMMIQKCDVKIVRRDDQSPLGQYDQQLLLAIKRRFKNFTLSVLSNASHEKRLS